MMRHSAVRGFRASWSSMDVVEKEWCALGRELYTRCPDKFLEIVDVLREVVGVQQLITQIGWLLAVKDNGKTVPKS